MNTQVKTFLFLSPINTHPLTRSHYLSFSTRIKNKLDKRRQTNRTQERNNTMKTIQQRINSWLTLYTQGTRHRWNTPVINKGGETRTKRGGGGGKVNHNPREDKTLKIKQEVHKRTYSADLEVWMLVIGTLASSFLQPTSI